MTSENSIKIETLSPNRSVTLKSAGTLILNASGVNHTEITPQFLTISSAGVLGRSSGSGSGSGTVTSVSAGNGMNFTTITGSGSVTMGTPGTLTNSTTNNVTATSHTHSITNFALSGTTNQITVTGSGRVLGATTTLSLPQNIHTEATPTFGGLNLDGDISTRAPALQNAGGFVAVFQSDPDSARRTLSNRTLAQFKSDLGVSPGGANGNIQFNNSGNFGGTNNLH